MHNNYGEFWVRLKSKESAMTLIANKNAERHIRHDQTIAELLRQKGSGKEIGKMRAKVTELIDKGELKVIQHSAFVTDANGEPLVAYFSGIELEGGRKKGKGEGERKGDSLWVEHNFKVK
jgi:hypothetical protein